MKKLVKILAWIAGIIVALIIIAIVVFNLFFQDDAKAWAIEKGSATLGRSISVADINLSFWGGLGVELDSVVVGNPPEFGGDFLSAQNVDVKLKFWPLLTGEYELSRLIINDPKISLIKLADGANNYTFAALDTALADTGRVAERMKEMPPETKTAATAVSFDRLEINRGRLTYTNDSSDISVVMVNFDLSTSLRNTQPDVFQSSGRMSMDSLEISAGDKYPVFAISLNYSASYDFDRDLLSVDRADFRLNQLRAELTGQIANMFGETDARLSVRSDQMSIQDLLSLLPASRLELLQGYDVSGAFSVNADFEYDASAETDPMYYNGTAVISDLQMSKSDIEGKLILGKALLDFKPNNLRISIEDGSFGGKPLKGYLTVDNFENPTVRGELAGQLNLAFVSPFLPVGHQHRLSGNAAFDITFSGEVDKPQNMQFKGTLNVSDGTYNSDLLPEPLQSFSIDAYFDNSLLKINRLSGKFPSGSFDFDGRVTDLVPFILADSAHAATMSPSIDGTIKGDLDLATLQRYLPEKGKPEVTGRFTMNLSLAGSLTEPSTIRPRGTISITDASYSDTLLPEPITSFTLDMSIVPDTITISRLSAQFESSDVSLNGRLIRPFPYLLPIESINREAMRKPMLLFTLTSSRFDTDKLFPEAVPGSGANIGTGGAARDSVSVSMVLLPDVDGQGTFSVDTLIYTQVPFTDITGKIKIEDRIITAYDATGNVYSGTVAGETAINLSNFEKPVYTGKFTAKQIEANDFVARFTRFGGHLFGKINLDGTYEATGWESEAFLNSLTLNGDGKMQDGKLITSGASYALLEKLAELSGQTFDKEQTLKGLNSAIKVEDGKVFLDKLKAELGKIGEVSIDGYYGFNGNLDYSGTILLSESMSKDVASKLGLGSSIANLLTSGSTPRFAVPVKIGGTVDNPSFEIDKETLQKNIADKLKGDAGNLLKGLFKKK